MTDPRINRYTIGDRVRLNFLNHPVGEVVSIQESWELCGEKYKVRWDDGEESGWLRESDLSAGGVG